MKNIPNECKKFLVINDTEGGMFSDKVSEDDTIKFQAEYATGFNMRTIGKLVANIPVQGKDAESQLPSHYHFYKCIMLVKLNN